MLLSQRIDRLLLNVSGGFSILLVSAMGTGLERNYEPLVFVVSLDLYSCYTNLHSGSSHFSLSSSQGGPPTVNNYDQTGGPVTSDQFEHAPSSESDPLAGGAFNSGLEAPGGTHQSQTALSALGLLIQDQRRRRRSHEDCGPLLNGPHLDNFMNVDSDSLVDDKK
nr:hypothetical protein Iba_chr04eCG17110 [Ipomoea batatas]